MSCVMGVQYKKRFYEARSSADVPDLGDPISGVVVPDCNDTGGPQGPGIPVTAYAVGNYCTTDVIAAEFTKGDEPMLFVAMN